MFLWELLGLNFKRRKISNGDWTLRLLTFDDRSWTLTDGLKLRGIKWWPRNEELDDTEMGVHWAVPTVPYRSLIVFEGGGLDVCVCVCVCIYFLYVVHHFLIMEIELSP